MKQIVILFFLYCSLSISAQNVGINLLNPEYTLDVRSLSIEAAGQFNVSNQDKSRYLRLYTGSDTYPDPSMTWSPGNNLLFATYNDATFDFTEYMRIDSSGNVGIQVPNPEANLDVKGGDWNLDAGNPGDVRIGNPNFNFRIGVATGGGGAGITRLFSSSQLRLGTDSITRVTIDTDGETGFGTTNPSQKVHINGKIKIGNDNKAPSEGTIRYNQTTKSFEGYDGAKWINLGGSSPYGSQGTYNLPDYSFYLSHTGDLISFVADQDLIALRSREQIVIGIQTFPPFDPILDDLIHVQLYEKQSNGDWESQLAFTSSEYGSNANFSYTMKLSETRFLISDTYNRKVYEFTKSGGVWIYTNTFESPDSNTNDKYGSTIDINGLATIIGAPARDFIASYGPGKAYIYGDSDNLEATVQGPGPMNGDGFGSSVSLSTNRAVVGAPYDDYGSLTNAGSATIFNKFNGNWSTNNTFFDQTPEADENYGYVRLENANFLYIMGTIEGIDSYAVENGYWTLKETIQAQGDNSTITGYDTREFEKLLFRNYSSSPEEISFLIALERDVNNYFLMTSSLLLGDQAIKNYEIVDDAIYVLGDDDKIYVYEY